MAIADAEPKKGDVDVTSTGSSTGGVKDMSRPSHGLVKYSSLKDFSFSVSDVWDDLNICIFLECCHANLTDLKNYNGSEENKVWEKIAKSGLERAGSISCFNVNYCLELAKCLKSFVSKNENKMMNNEIFRILHENVADLLPYFAPAQPKTKGDLTDNKVRLEKPSLYADNDIMKKFMSEPDSTQALKTIYQILSKYNSEELVKLKSSRNSLWKEVSSQVENKFGVKVNPKEFLESQKGSVIAAVRTHRHQDRKQKAELFLKKVGDMLPFFDLIAPKNVKRSDFLEVGDEVPKETAEPSKSEGKKRKRDMSEEDNIEPSLKSTPKTSSLSTNSEPVLTCVNLAKPVRTYSKRKSEEEDDLKSNKKSSGCADSCSPRPPDFLDDWATSSADDTSEPIAHQEKVPTHAEPKPKMRIRKRKAESKALVDGPSTKSANKSIGLITRSKGSDSRSSAAATDGGTIARIPTTSNYDRLRESPTLGTTDSSRVDGAESDSDIEDVPLVGTNVLYPRHSANVRNMQPVVILEKMAAEELLRAAKGTAGVKRTRRGRQPKMLHKLVSTPAVSSETAIVRRRPGRPKNSSVTRAKVSARPAAHTPVSAALVRSTPKRATTSKAAYFTKDLTPTSSVLVPSPSVVPHGNNGALANSHVAPEWIRQFTVEIRRQEIWKMRMYLNLHNELVQSESKKTDTLERIFKVLSTRYERV